MKEIKFYLPGKTKAEVVSCDGGEMSLKQAINSLDNIRFRYRLERRERELPILCMSKVSPSRADRQRLHSTFINRR